MHVSSKKLSPQRNTELLQQLILVLSELKNIDATKVFVRDFFTETEQTVLVKRLAIAFMLNQKKSYGEIAQELHVSSATISSVAEMLDKKGIQVALEKIHEEKWAEEKLQKLKKLLPFG